MQILPETLPVHDHSIKDSGLTSVKSLVGKIRLNYNSPSTSNPKVKSTSVVIAVLQGQVLLSSCAMLWWRMEERGGDCFR